MNEIISAYIIYQWDCPCGEVNQFENVGPEEELLECDGCGEEYEVQV